MAAAWSTKRPIPIDRLRELTSDTGTSPNSFKAKAAKDEARAQALMAEVASLKSDIQAGEAADRTIQAELEAALAEIPNVPQADVPDGADETGNVEVRPRYVLLHELLKEHGRRDGTARASPYVCHISYGGIDMLPQPLVVERKAPHPLATSRRRRKEVSCEVLVV